MCAASLRSAEWWVAPWIGAAVSAALDDRWSWPRDVLLRASPARRSGAYAARAAPLLPVPGCADRQRLEVIPGAERLRSRGWRPEPCRRTDRKQRGPVSRTRAPRTGHQDARLRAVPGARPPAPVAASGRNRVNELQDGSSAETGFVSGARPQVMARRRRAKCQMPRTTSAPITLPTIPVGWRAEVSVAPSWRRTLARKPLRRLRATGAPPRAARPAAGASAPGPVPKEAEGPAPHRLALAVDRGHPQADALERPGLRAGRGVPPATVRLSGAHGDSPSSVVHGSSIPSHAFVSLSQNPTQRQNRFGPSRPEQIPFGLPSAKSCTL